MNVLQRSWLCLVFSSYIQLHISYIYHTFIVHISLLNFLDCIIAVWYGNKFKPGRIATDNLTFWTITARLCSDVFLFSDFNNGQPRHFVLTFCRTTTLALFLACSFKFFAKTKAFVVIKLFLYKKECTFMLLIARSKLFAKQVVETLSLN